MEDKYIILSDIHGNVSAFDAVASDCQDEEFAGIILLGDCIDYGMRSNEIIQKLMELDEGVIIAGVAKVEDIDDNSLGGDEDEENPDDGNS